MPKNQNKQKNAQKNGQINISQQEYKQLISRPKPTTLRRDERQQGVRVGKRSRNPYLATLIDPVHVTGVKVPDVTSFPTATFQLYQRNDITISATGNHGMAYSMGLVDFRSSNSTMDGAAAWGAWSAADMNTAAQPIFHSYRPVSGLVRVYTTASSMTNQGELIACILPPGELLSTVNSATKMANKWGAFRDRLKTGLEILWMPVDPHSRTYNSIGQAIIDGSTDSWWPALAVAIEGAEVGSVVVFEVFINYEAIPEQATFNLVQATAPYISSSDSEEATGIISKMGTFGRQYGEDVGSWLMDQGAVAAGEITRSLAGAAVHYVSSRVGLFGKPNRNVIVH
jgi:hypothetical protein